MKTLSRNFVFLFVMALCLKLLSCTQALSSFDIMQSHDEAISDVMRASGLAEKRSIRSLTQCAHLCSSESQCVYSVYSSPAQMCRLIGDTQMDRQTLDSQDDVHVTENDFVAIRKLAGVGFSKKEVSSTDASPTSHALDSPSTGASPTSNSLVSPSTDASPTSNSPVSCENGGVLQDDNSCVCVPGFQGRFCEVSNPLSDSGWTLATAQDYLMLATFQVPMRIVLNSEMIVSVTVFEKVGDGYVLQANNFLSLDLSANGQTVIPMKAEQSFMLCSFPSEDCLTAKVGRQGEVTTIAENGDDIDIKLYFRNDRNGNWLVFNDGSASIPDVVAALSEGYSLLRRELAVTNISPHTQNALVQNGPSRLRIVGAAALDWERPLTFQIIQESLKTNTRYVLNHLAGAPTTISRDQEEMTSSNWVIDQSWRRLTNPTRDAIREYISNGHDLRVIVNGTRAFDLTSMLTSSNDIIINLAPFLASLGPGAELSNKNNYWVMSQSGRMTVCETEFQGSNVLHFDMHDSLDLEWVVDTKNWTKVYHSKNGQGIGGSFEDLKESVISGKIIRICKQFGAFWVFCHECMSIQVTRQHGILCTSPPFHPPKTKKKKFVSNEDGNCVPSFEIASSLGFSQRATFTNWELIEKDVPVNAFMEMSWFVEK